MVNILIDLSLVTLYMIFNVLTDLKTLKTKNLNHLMFFVIGIILILFEGVWLKFFLTILTTLIIGLIRENIKRFRISSGDTKMLVVISTYILMMFPFCNSIFLAISIHLIYWFISLFIMVFILSIIKLTPYFKRLEGEKETFKKGMFMVNATYQGKKLIGYKYSSPEALSIFLTMLVITYLLGGNKL